MFGTRATDITIWENDAAVQSPLLRVTYGPLPTDGKPHLVSFTVDGNRIVTLLPDGTTRIAEEPRLSKYSGNHLIYQVSEEISPKRKLTPKMAAGVAEQPGGYALAGGLLLLFGATQVMSARRRRSS